MEEKQNIFILLLGQTSPLTAGCVCGPSSNAYLPTNLHRKPRLIRPKCLPLPHAHSRS